MADDLLMLFDVINFPDSRQVSLPRINSMESYDEKLKQVSKQLKRESN